MKIMCIGDIHGEDYWKVFPMNEFDKVIFLGDYVDSYDITDEQIIKNLQDIIQYKKDNPEKCILLIGNHDLQYIFSYESNGCSGFRLSYYHTLKSLFKTNIDLFQVAYQVDKYLFTHAGISSIWWERFQKNMKDNTHETLNRSIADILNREYELKNIILYDVGRVRGGWTKSGGIFWADESELKKWMHPNYNQIVGHTRVKEIYTHEWKEGNASITFCDTLYDYYELNL